ncbi:MAG: hypothetical protein KGI33_02875 [Thaumarchaeota archaeon]|nr:hypothetical protein [Nitrososphaerota archaeon]
MKYIGIGKKLTSKNNLGVVSFVFAAIGFIIIIFSFFNLSNPHYSSLTYAAFALLLASIATGALAKRKSKKATT